METVENHNLSPTCRLWSAVLHSAVNDYFGAHEMHQKSAEMFLFGKTPEFEERLDLACSAVNINPKRMQAALIEGRLKRINRTARAHHA